MKKEFKLPNVDILKRNSTKDPDIQLVSMYELITSKEFQESKFELPIILGKTSENKTYVIDLTKAPHMLIGGEDKSMGINTILTSLLYKKHPEELKLVLISSSKKELSIYAKIEKHYLAKLPEEDAVIIDTQKAVSVLNSLGKEMDVRFDLLKNANARNIVEYNQKVDSNYLPYVVVVIEELANLIMTVGKDVEVPIARMAQLARATGIHLIIATQRPSINVITGMIKANFPTRIAFRVAQSFSSRIILDTLDAEQLKNKGDVLINQDGETIHLRCPFISTTEIEKLISNIETQETYSTILLLKPNIEPNIKQKDKLLKEAALFIVQTQKASTLSLQQKFSIGYNQASQIMAQLEKLDIIGPYSGNKNRTILITDESALEQILNQ